MATAQSHEGYRDLEQPLTEQQRPKGFLATVNKKYLYGGLFIGFLLVVLLARGGGAAPAPVPAPPAPVGPKEESDKPQPPNPVNDDPKEDPKPAPVDEDEKDKDPKPQPPVVKEDAIELVYISAWNPPYLHYKDTKGFWTELPGEEMKPCKDSLAGFEEEKKAHTCWSLEVAWNGQADFEFVPWDGNHFWDKAEDNANYYIDKAGTWVLRDGKLAKL